MASIAIKTVSVLCRLTRATTSMFAKTLWGEFVSLELLAQTAKALECGIDSWHIIHNNYPSLIQGRVVDLQTEARKPLHIGFPSFSAFLGL